MAQFPEEVYKNAGASDVLPLVMKNLDAEKVLAVQFLRAGRVRLTFQDSETCSQVLKEGLDLGDVSVQLLPADDRLRTVHLRDLPVEIDEEVVSSCFLAEFGEVLYVSHCFFDDYPTVRNGNRMAKILLDRNILQFVEVHGCSCRVWYRRQPAQCTICRQSGHRAPACPLSGCCQRCHQPGHVARECTQAWGQSLSAPRTMDVSTDVEVNDSSASDSTIVPESGPVKVPVSTPPVNVSSDSTDPLTMSAASVSTASRSTTSTTSVSTVPLTTSTASTVSLSAPKPQSSRPVSAKKYCARLSKFPCADLPDFDQATGKERDTKAKVYIRQRMKVMFESKEVGLYASDLRTWTENDLHDVSRLVCEILSIRNYLVDFVYGIIRTLWSNARKV